MSSPSPCPDVRIHRPARAPHRSSAPLVAVVAALVVLAAGCGDSGQTAAAPGSSDRVTTRSDPPTTADPDGARTSSTPAGRPVPSPGCGTSTVRAVTDERRTVQSGGTERWYLLTTPPQHDGSDPLPLLLDVHGLAEGAEVHARMTGFDALAPQDGFVVAHPNGTGSPVHWEVAPTNNADLVFTDDMIDQLGHDLCIDLSRVYATGLSNGAMFSSTLACQRPDRIAAIAPVAGLQYGNGCQTERPVPVLTFHGTADPILLFNGGIGNLSGLMSGSVSASDLTLAAPVLDGAGYPEAVRRWAAHNHCRPRPDETNPVTDVIRRSYDCPKDGPVEFYIVEGGGHSWPGSAFSQSIAKIVGPTNMDLDASGLIWAFLSAHRLPSD